MTKLESKPGASPDELLKAAVGGPQAPMEVPAASAVPAVATAAALLARLGRDRRQVGIAGAALAAGAVLGAGIATLSSPGRSPNDAVIALGTTLDASRIETARLSGEVAQIHQALMDLRSATDAARKEAAARNTSLGERLGQIDKTVSTKIAAVGDRFEQVEREQTARIVNLAALVDKRPAASASAPVAKAEPTQTGSIGEKPAEAKVADTKAVEVKVTDKPKPAQGEKPPVIDGWAVRDVYDGTAMLENRRRRLVEVGPGDMLPGIGRVEAVERHGRDWVVVTRQGLVTPQPW